MTDTAQAIRTGRLDVSRITYHTNLQHASGLIIPLGVIAELTIGSWRALGLIARMALSDDELCAIAPVLRDRLRGPFTFLASEFDRVIAETEAGEALGSLSRRFFDSIFFAPPQGHQIRKVLPLAAMAASSILVDLRKERDEEFYVMLAEAMEVSEAVSSEDRTKLLARRAA
jgi:hypothetical protein